MESAANLKHYKTWCGGEWRRRGGLARGILRHEVMLRGVARRCAGVSPNGETAEEADWLICARVSSTLMVGKFRRVRTSSRALKEDLPNLPSSGRDF